MRKRIFQIGIFSTALILASCGGNANNETTDETTAADTAAVVEEEVEQVPEGAMSSNGITVYKADLVKEFPDAKLTLESPKPEDVQGAGTQTFSYSVENYELAAQTPGAEERHCANSEKGQHIHFILNNSPYTAHYEPSFDADLAEGNNVVLSFLSRSYHESIKNGDAYTLVNYKVGETTEEFDENAEHLFYSRPKGTYSGKDAQKILLDFYLVNAELAADGNKVVATIDGNEFVLDAWEPYFVEGLGNGEHTFRIRLVDSEGNLVPGPFNDSGDRTITLENVPSKDEMANMHGHNHEEMNHGH